MGSIPKYIGKTVIYGGPISEPQNNTSQTLPKGVPLENSYFRLFGICQLGTKQVVITYDTIKGVLCLFSSMYGSPGIGGPQKWVSL